MVLGAGRVQQGPPAPVHLVAFFPRRFVVSIYRFSFTSFIEVSPIFIELRRKLP